MSGARSVPIKANPPQPCLCHASRLTAAFDAPPPGWFGPRAWTRHLLAGARSVVHTWSASTQAGARYRLGLLALVLTDSTRFKYPFCWVGTRFTSRHRTEPAGGLPPPGTVYHAPFLLIHRRHRFGQQSWNGGSVSERQALAHQLAAGPIGRCLPCHQPGRLLRFLFSTLCSGALPHLRSVGAS